MALSAFLGPLLIGLGPGAVFFTTFIAKKSFLVLLSFFSCFIYFIALLLISSIFKGFFPLSTSNGSYSAYLITAVAIEELFRIGIWYMHKYVLSSLSALAHQRDRRLSSLDRTYLAMAWGTGHAACHILFLFLAPLPLAAEGGGTYYLSECHEMSFFLVSSINVSAIGGVLLAAMIIALEGAISKDWRVIVCAPILHLTASLITLGNYTEGGCIPVAIALYVLCIASIAFSLFLVRRQTLLKSSYY